MTRRLPILIPAVIAAIAVAVPAFAAPAKVTPKLDQRSVTRALAKARLALLTARSAKSQSRVAVRTAGAAVNTANEAKGVATATQAALDSTRIQSGFAAGGVSTESETPVQLPGGPTVTVAVPSSGLIEVWAQARIDEGGAVALYEDGQRMAGQNETPLCTEGETGGILFAGIPIGPGPTIVGTPSPAGTCGTEGAPGSVLFQTSPGVHTYELRYLLGCSCEPKATFSKRSLRVGPRL
jgi:hypothetical protein